MKRSFVSISVKQNHFVAIFVYKCLMMLNDVEYTTLKMFVTRAMSNYLCYFFSINDLPGGGTPILGHIRDVQPEWVSFPGRKPADGCKFLTKNLRMGHNFDIILPGNGRFSSKLNKTYCSLVNFYC